MNITVGTSPVNILMVDDQRSKLLSYEVMLAELGENLVKAPSGREALELLLKTDFAVVLMDVSMPELDGFELAEMIRQHPRFQKTAIIFISAVHLTDVDRLKGYERGAVDYISVPIIPELLRAKVSVFAELHRKTRQLEALNQELNRLSNSLMNAQDEERRRIARELHDGLGQDLAAAKMMLGAWNQPYQSPESRDQAMAEANLMLDHAIKQVRTISHLLHPPLLDEMGLLSALRWYTEGFQRRSGIETKLEVQRSSLDLERKLKRRSLRSPRNRLPMFSGTPSPRTPPCGCKNLRAGFPSASLTTGGVFLGTWKPCAREATASASLASNSACRIMVDSSFFAAQTPAPWSKSRFQLRARAVNRSVLAAQMFRFVFAFLCDIKVWQRLIIRKFAGTLRHIEYRLVMAGY